MIAFGIHIWSHRLSVLQRQQCGVCSMFEWWHLVIRAHVCFLIIWENEEFLSWQAGLQHSEHDCLLPVATGNLLHLAFDVWRLCGQVWKIISFGWRFIIIILYIAWHVLVVIKNVLSVTPKVVNSQNCMGTGKCIYFLFSVPFLLGCIKSYKGRRPGKDRSVCISPLEP